MTRSVDIQSVVYMNGPSDLIRAAEAVAATANSGRVLDGLAKKLKASLGQFRV